MSLTTGLSSEGSLNHREKLTEDYELDVSRQGLLLKIIMKRAVKFTLMITGIVSLCFSCLFSKPVAAATIYNAYIYAVKSTWWVRVNYDYEYEYDDIEFITDYTNLRAYIEDGNSAASDVVDDSYPTFLVADTTYHSNSNSIPMSSRCLAFDDLTQYDVTLNMSQNYWLDVMSMLLNSTNQGNGALSGYITYQTLYSLGYRISAYTSISAGGTAGYLYVLNKFTGADRINFLNTTTDSDGNISSTLHQNDQWTFFERWDFNTYNLTDRSNNQSLDFVSGSDYITTTYPQLILKSNDLSDIYAINDMQVKYTPTYMNDELYAYDLTFYITGNNPYIIFQLVKYNDAPGSAINKLNRTIYDQKMCTLFKGAGNDLSSINQHLVTIEDLLSDLQVQEINNIYQDITNEYNVDIDLTINNVIDDLRTNINSFDFTDENYQIPETDLQKISGFRLIFSNMIQTMNSNGLGMMWFLPLILLIIGALL